MHDGVATTGEIDDAIRFGPGLRWAQMGTFLTYRIAGGEGGMRHFFAQFGPALQWPWTKLMDVPELTDELLDAIVAQSDEQADGLSVRELERRRDDNLVGDPAGAARRRRRGAGGCCASTRSGCSTRARPRCRRSTRPRRCGCTRSRVRSDWVDYNGHMTESRYLDVLANATDAFLRHVERRTPRTSRAATASTRPRRTSATSPRSHAGDRLDVETQVLGADEKRLHLFHTHARTGAGTTGRDG